MTLNVFFAVLCAAFMHASWNVLIKLQLDRFLALVLLQTLMGFMGLLMVVVFGLPSWMSLPFAVASGFLHTGYNIFLARSYKKGQLSQVYPIARGTAPLFILVITLITGREVLSLLTVAGILTLIAGIWLIALDPKAAAKLDRQSLIAALITSCFIAAYTLVDGLGGRASNAPSAYTGLVFVLDALIFAIYALWNRGTGIFTIVAPFWRSGLLGAALSAGAYWIAIWAMTLAPIAAVAALRETSILFVMAMSARYLQEQMPPSRLFGAALVLVGAVVLRLA